MYLSCFITAMVLFYLESKLEFRLYERLVGVQPDVEESRSTLRVFGTVLEISD